MHASVEWAEAALLSVEWGVERSISNLTQNQRRIPDWNSHLHADVQVGPRRDKLLTTRSRRFERPLGHMHEPSERV